jgi:hypothetical protein
MSSFESRILIDIIRMNKLLNSRENKVVMAATILHKITKNINENGLTSTFEIRMIMSYKFLFFGLLSHNHSHS